jgi:hypothetical protein
MAHDVEIHHYGAAIRNGWRTHPTLSTAISATFGMLIGALLFAIVVSTVDIVRATLVGPPSAVPEITTTPRALAPDWRSQPETGTGEHDHMYYRTPTQNLDWLRNSGKR